MTRTSLFRTLAALLFVAVLPPPAVSQDVPEGSPEAIAEFAEGVKFYVGQQYTEAVTHFMRAHELDDSFVVSLFMASLCQGNLGNGAESRALQAEVWAQRERLSPYYQNRLETQMALLAGDRTTALRLARATAEAAPGTKALYNLAYIANGSLLPEESLQALDALDPDREPMRAWYGYRGVRAGALHQLGRFGDELEVGRDAWLDFPERQAALNIQARALGALGDAAGLEALWSECSTLQPTAVAYTPGALMSVAAAEAWAHGHEALSRDLYRRSAEWWDGEETGGASRTVRNWYSQALYGAGRLDDAFQVMSGVLAESPNNPWYHTAVGFIEVARGNEARARQELDWLTLPHEGLVPAWRAVYQAYIHASLGDGDETLRLLEDAVNMGVAYQVWWHRHPAFAPVMDHEGFRDFITPKH